MTPLPAPHLWAIDPVPDFLGDHTLTGERPAERIVEVVSRWVQFLASLWAWRGAASFALRYAAAAGRVRVGFLARAHDPAESARLRDEADVLLRTFRLTDRGPADAAGRAAWDEATDLATPAIVEVRQFVSRSLWVPTAGPIDPAAREARDRAGPPVVFPWWAPGGPFLAPLESLLAQPVPVTLTAYLAPTELSAAERQSLAALAREAKSQGDQTLQQIGVQAGRRLADPAAELAGRLLTGNFRRLSAAPFLVAVHCAADGEPAAARTLAGAVQAIVQEQPFDRPQQDDTRLPSESEVRPGADAAADQYRELVFPAFPPADPAARLPYLADARGAATVFRLPVSVRGGVPGVRVRQPVPDHHPGPRLGGPPDARRYVSLGTFASGGAALVPLGDLCKHALVTGFTGSGKTVTVLNLLHQLWADHRVPLLVLESAKQEYRGLFGVPAFATDLRVYTAGNELVAPFRLNPFELLPGVRVEAHLGRLQTCFEAAIPPIGPSASVIAEALLRAYEARGWCLTDVYPAAGESRRRFPVLSEFVAAVEEVIRDRGYDGEVKHNVRAALVGRFKPLLIGGKGRMFDTPRSSPSPAELFAAPTVLELNDLNLDDKALVVMFLLTFLREFRERNRPAGGELLHVTLVEEAHNVLENVGSKGGGEGATSADTRFKAVEAFCQLLTEVRALGEGLVIADQSPEKLARDAMRNTNLQIAHQLRDGHDREAIASAMIMDDEQRDYIGKLEPGHAAVFMTGLEKATFVRVPRYAPPPGGDPAGCRGAGFVPVLSDDDLADRMLRLRPGLASVRSLSLPLDACHLCRAKCGYRDPVFAAAGGPEAGRAADAWRQTYLALAGKNNPAFWAASAAAARWALVRAGLDPADADAGWCAFAHLWHDSFGQPADPKHRLDGDHADLFRRHFTRGG